MFRMACGSDQAAYDAQALHRRGGPQRHVAHIRRSARRETVFKRTSNMAGLRNHPRGNRIRPTLNKFAFTTWDNSFELILQTLT